MSTGFLAHTDCTDHTDNICWQSSYFIFNTSSLILSIRIIRVQQFCAFCEFCETHHPLNPCHPCSTFRRILRFLRDTSSVQSESSVFNISAHSASSARHIIRVICEICVTSSAISCPQSSLFPSNCARISRKKWCAPHFFFTSTCGFDAQTHSLTLLAA